MTVRDTQMVRDQKKFENHWAKGNSDGVRVTVLWSPEIIF